MFVCYVLPTVCRYWDGMYPLVQAQNNWWGKGTQSYVAGRILDRMDDDNLIQVANQPFMTDNTSVLEGELWLSIRGSGVNLLLYG